MQPTSKAEIFADLQKRMNSALQVLDHDLQGIRTGRASSNLLDNVQVDAYGSYMHINQVGTITVPEPRLITVQVWDKGMVKAVEKGIVNANLGLNPSIDGQTIRVPVPALTEERRKELVKIARQYAEKAKVAIRNVRRDGIDQAKKLRNDNTFTEDEERNCADEIQKLTDKFVADIDQRASKKEQEILA